jgi:hypothetical protein
MIAVILVPKKGTPAHQNILPGSAIVSKRLLRENLLHPFISCWYEGNKYKAENLNQFHERLTCASGRMTRRYPTTALQAHPHEDLTAVALFDTIRYVVVEVMDEKLLTDWSGEPIEMIVGRRIEKDTGWQTFCEIIHFQGRPLSPHGSRYKTRTGQIVFVDPENKSFSVMEHSDPRLETLLADLDDDAYLSATGSWRN